MVKFSCDTADIKAAIAHIRAALPRGKQQLLKAKAELDIKPDKTTISVVGASYTLHSRGKGFGKVYVPVVLLLRAVETTQSPTFWMDFEKGRARFDDTQVSSPGIELTHPENQSKMELPLNLRPITLLKLSNRHSLDELTRMGLYEKLLLAERKMEQDLDAACQLLKPYGFSYEELRQQMNSKIEGD